MKKIASLLIVLFYAPFVVLSHEGHNKTPGALSAPHGGQIKGTDKLYIELVSEKTGFKIFPLTHEMKSIDLKEINVEGDYKFPKSKKSEKIQWNFGESFLEAKVDTKGAHRYSVDLKIKFDGKVDKLNFNVEPQE